MRVRLPVFEGPLDLLLYLIRKEELDIYDVAIEKVTTQYLDFIRAMKEMDLEVAGEFLVVASTLVYIKSRNLLPKDVQPPEDEAEEDDPRWELVRQLVEYKKFKDAAFQLQLRHTANEKAFERLATPDSEDSRAPTPAMTMLVGEVGIFDLVSAFQKVLERAQSRNKLAEIVEDKWTVGDKIRHIDALIQDRLRMRFEELFEEDASRTEMVVTFLALLELVRLKRLRVLQDFSFAGIILERRTGATGPIPSGPSGFEE
ncbi:chromosome segregation protein ScpA [Verrucomicrobia bacterium LW23]|nr:chromosome segregation protein ScpA [Verrucomicrobia bacterium LW23]